MIDDAFHLTPLDVRRYEFGTAIRGYDKVRVDQFREQVAAELERVLRINQDLDAKAKTLAEQLKSFRERDKALNEALVSAQQLRAESRDQAEREATLILREAQAEAERIVEAARNDIRRLEDEVTALERTRRTHVAQQRAPEVPLLLAYVERRKVDHVCRAPNRTVPSRTRVLPSSTASS